LKDTGDFYKSFTVNYIDSDIVIDADGQKDDNNLFEEYGDDILGLNDLNMTIFVDEVTKKIKFFILNK
jgi:hypothetical protein